MYKLKEKQVFFTFFDYIKFGLNMMTNGSPIKCNYYEDNKIRLLEKPLDNVFVVDFILSYVVTIKILILNTFLDIWISHKYFIFLKVIYRMFMVNK